MSFPEGGDPPRWWPGPIKCVCGRTESAVGQVWSASDSRISPNRGHHRWKGKRSNKSRRCAGSKPFSCAARHLATRITRPSPIARAGCSELLHPAKKPTPRSKREIRAASKALCPRQSLWGIQASFNIRPQVVVRRSSYQRSIRLGRRSLATTKGRNRFRP